MFLSLVQKRRSIRKFQLQPVEAEKINSLFEAALRAPSSMAHRPWEFIAVTDKGLIEKLSRVKLVGSDFLKGAPLAFVVCADPAKSSVWVEDASIAAIFIHLAAESLGLGGCWIQIRERMHDETMSSEAYIRQLLKIPEYIKVVAIVAVGYPDERKPPHKKEGLQYQKAYRDYYGDAYKF